LDPYSNAQKPKCNPYPKKKSDQEIDRVS
jgi:hypothetical protein